MPRSWIVGDDQHHAIIIISVWCHYVLLILDRQVRGIVGYILRITLVTLTI